MQVLLDENVCDVVAGTVAEAIAACATLAQAQGRLIVDVHVDGTRWSEQQLESSDRQTATAEIVELTTADPSQLVLQTFDDAAEALTDADELQHEAAELLQSDQRTICMDKLGEALSIWLTVQQAIVKGSQVVGLKLDDITVDGTPIVTSITRLNEQLKMLRTSLEQEDQIALADALLYEFPDVVREWRGILQHLRTMVEQETE